MADLSSVLAHVEGFQWDPGNTGKNVLGHGVSLAEAEEIFFHTPVLLLEDVKHSIQEQRLVVLGSTNAGRRLTASFTMRGRFVRIISVRDMSRKERRSYEEAR